MLFVFLFVPLVLLPRFLTGAIRGVGQVRERPIHCVDLFTSTPRRLPIALRKRPYFSRPCRSLLARACCTACWVAGVMISIRPTKTREIAAGAGWISSGRMPSTAWLGTM